VSSASGHGNAISMTITKKGFQFLLQDVNTQIWAFLLQYLDMVQVVVLSGSITGSLSNV
jgi:hypothetical protein